jgi:cytochrome P450
MFRDLFGSSFLFAKGDETWKLKRKACAPGFYKDKLIDLIEAMKDTSNDYAKAWKDQIKASSSN